MAKMSEKAKRFNENFKKRVNRQHALSLAVCAHCGMCNESCHYFLATKDPKMTPAYKADRIRRLYKKHFDWLGKVAPFWVGASSVKTDEDLEELKDIFFGACTGCRRCTVNCPFGVDMAAVVGLTRSLLVDEKVAPDGVLTVMKDQWETGNQMAITQEDYLETLEWLEEELQDELGEPDFKIPVDKEGADFVYVINPREIKYSPMSLQAAAKIFHVAGLNWTMGSVGWDNTNFGLFSGKPDLGGHMGNLAYDHAKKLGVKQMVISECGHGLRSTKWEAPNWGKANPLPFEIISVLDVMVDLINSCKIILDPSKNPLPVTYHDPCNLSRSCGITEEPRFCLKRACMDYREMTPSRADSYCCTGGGGAMSMAEYAKRRLSVSGVKAEQIRSTGAAAVATACHNCADGLTDLIKENRVTFTDEKGNAKLLPVKNVCEFVADAIVIPKEVPKIRRVAKESTKGKLVLVTDDQPDVTTYLKALLEDNGYRVITAQSGEECLQKARAERPELITLDITMPGKSGVKVFHDLREPGSATEMIPVFIVTGATDFRQLMYQKTVEAPEGFMKKPIDEDAFVMTVGRILQTSPRKHPN
jgi:Fe-S oxidoreductase/ActR/RegA family two-component response regulator